MQVHDPVCGKLMDLEDTIGSEDHEGWAYFFCSERCLELFLEFPKRFATEHPQIDANPNGTNARERSRCEDQSCPH